MFRENIMRQSKSSIHTRFKQLAFAALIGGQLLGECERGWRIAGAVFIAVGVAALAMAR